MKVTCVGSTAIFLAIELYDNWWVSNDIALCWGRMQESII